MIASDSEMIANMDENICQIYSQETLVMFFWLGSSILIPIEDLFHKQKHMQLSKAACLE